MGGSARRTAARLTAAALAMSLFAACGGDGDGEVDSLEAAQARVSAAERAVEDAEAELSAAADDFCADGAEYLEAIDRYGDVFDDDATTVGDVTTAASDLDRPAEAVEDSAGDVQDAQDDLAAAEAELADAQDALLIAQSSTTVESSTTTTTPAVAPASIEEVRSAQEDLAGVSEEIGPDTPLVEASAQLNSAAFALEVAWLRVFADAGCLTDEQQAEAVAAVTSYTTTLQQSLQKAGYYDGPIDGLYGTATVEAVQALQAEAGLPTTGYVDEATAAALADALGEIDGATATEAVAHTAAVQSVLSLAGYWDGPVDGAWTPELTEAVKALQTDLGVEPTGVVDAATLAAVQQAIEDAQAAATTTTTEPEVDEAATTTTAAYE